MSGAALDVNPSGSNASNLTLNSTNGAATTVTPSRNPFASFGRRDRKGSVGIDEGKGKGRKMSLNLGNGRPSLNLGRPSMTVNQARPSMSGNGRTSMSLSNGRPSMSPNGRPSMNFSTEVLSPVIAIGREEEQAAEADVPMRRSVSLSRLEESLSRSEEERGWVGETEAGHLGKSGSTSRRDELGRGDEDQTLRYDKPLRNDSTEYDEFGVQLRKTGKFLSFFYITSPTDSGARRSTCSTSLPTTCNATVPAYAFSRSISLHPNSISDPS